MPTEHRPVDLQQARAVVSLLSSTRATRTTLVFELQMLLLEEVGPRRSSGATADVLALAKRHGFSDVRVASARHQRAARGPPCLSACGPPKTVLTPAPPSPPHVSLYLYSSHDLETEVASREREAVIILGSGPNRIGQALSSTNFCVHAAMARPIAGETVAVNCNPETAHDYDISDRLLLLEPLWTFRRTATRFTSQRSSS